MRILSVFLLLCLAWMAAGCNLPQPAAPAKDVSQAWLDAPLDGSLLPWAPYEVVFHGSAPEGVQQGEFSVNGQVQADSISPPSGESLVTFRLEWSPPAPGEYALQVRTFSKNGNWSESTVAHVMVVAATSTPTSTVTPTSTATPTVTATPTLIPTLTFTPTMIAWLFSNSSAPTQVYQGDCGVNQITFQVRVTPAENVKGMLVFTRWQDLSGSGDSGWDGGTPMSIQGNGLYTLKIKVSKLQGAGSFFSARILYQFVATDSSGKALSRSAVYDDVTATACIAIPTVHLPPFSWKTPTVTPQIVR